MSPGPGQGWWRLWRYGLHATLKAPFELKAGFAEADLHRALDELAGELHAVLPKGLRLIRLGSPGRSFLALVPEPGTGADLLGQILMTKARLVAWALGLLRP